MFLPRTQNHPWLSKSGGAFGIIISFLFTIGFVALLVIEICHPDWFLRASTNSQSGGHLPESRSEQHFNLLFNVIAIGLGAFATAVKIRRKISKSDV